MEFGVLGSFQVTDGPRPIQLRAPKQRTLLALLVCQANTAVSVDRLVDAVWGDEPPRTAIQNVRLYVYHLRRAMSDGERIVHRPPGYALLTRPGEVDAQRFETLAEQGQAALSAGDPARAAEVLREGLALWRGPAYAGFDDVDQLHDEAARLQERRCAVLEARIQAELALGRHADLVAELSGLTAEYPLRERWRVQLMLALYWSGRQAEALEVCRDTRRLLADELGLEPGPELLRLEQAILRGEVDAVDAVPIPSAMVTMASPARTVPAMLPPDVCGFTGRGDELAALDSSLAAVGQQPTAVVISAVSGTPGVGKTALAVHWAHRVAGRFPDGQLYVDLRGFDPSGRAVGPVEALAGFLYALGVRGEDHPATVDARVARYRSELAGRRMLVVLDNVATVEQVRPLLPGAPGCAVVVTSRDALAGLVALDGAHRLDLDVLPMADAVDLLRGLIGARIDAEPEAATVLAAQCARLPLALRVAAELVVARPATSLAVFVNEAADHQRRLDLFEASGDPRAAVRAVFSWSYQQLRADAALAFRSFGLHPGTDLDAYIAAALTGLPLDHAERLLHLLARAHLIHPDGRGHPDRRGRYGMHDLLRAYAGELANREDRETDRRAALTRLFDYYLAAAAAAMDSLMPAEKHRRPPVPLPNTAIPELGDPAGGRAWLDAERDNLVAVCVHAAGHGWASHTTRLATTLFRYLDTHGHYTEAFRINTCARDAARGTGDRAGEARALDHLGIGYWRHGPLPLAVDHLQQALAIFRRIAEPLGEARALANLGVVHWRQGELPSAVAHLQQALAIFRRIAEPLGEARALENLGLVYERQGKLEPAVDHLGQALTIFRQIGDATGEADALENLGLVYRRDGQFTAAARHLHQALVIFQEIGYRTAEAGALANLGLVCARQGSFQQALDYLRQALAIYRQTNDRAGEAETLNGQGETLRAIGATEQARARHVDALAVAAEIGDQFERARAHQGIADVHHAKGAYGPARRHWKHALALYADLGVPEADHVQSRLAALDLLRQ